MATAVEPVAVPVIGATKREESLVLNLASQRLPRRREFVALGLGAFVVAALPLASWRRRGIVRRTLPVMGTTADFTVVHSDARYADRAIDAAMSQLIGVENLMTRFRATSDVGRANARAAVAPVRISRQTADVIGAGLRWATASNGAFDPAVGRVVELWDVTHRREPPPEASVRRLAGRHFYRHVQVASESGLPAVYFASDDIHLDLGGIAVGYAVDLAAESLRSWGVRDALINVSGDIYALGTAPDGSPWRVGIQSPVDPAALIGEVELSDRALATSGDYQQFFMYRGRRYHHLMDPEHAAPRKTHIRTVTVLAERCIDADAASTAVFGMSLGEARRLLAVCAPGAEVVATL